LLMGYHTIYWLLRGKVLCWKSLKSSTGSFFAFTLLELKLRLALRDYFPAIANRLK